MISDLISKFVPSWVKFLPLVIALSVGGFLYYQNKSLTTKLIETNKELTSAENENLNLSSQLGDALKTASKQAESLQKLSTQARVAVEENNRLNRILEGYKGREQVAIDNPESIEHRANDAIANLLRSFECETGNSESCTE